MTHNVTLLCLIYFPGIKRQRREFDNSPTYTAEVLRNAGAVLLAPPPNPCMHLWHGRAVLYTFMFLRTKFFISETSLYTVIVGTYRGADKSLARPGRNKLQRQKILVFEYPIYYNWRNNRFIYIYIYIYIQQD